MEILKKKRRVIRAQATRVFNEPTTFWQNNKFLTSLRDVNAAIEPHILDDDADAEFVQVMEYDDKIASCLGSMKSFGNSLADGAQIRNVAPARTTAQVQIQLQKTRLPKLELKKFDAAIHKNHELSDIDRFNYLKSLLSGEAKEAIAGLQAMAECYADAIEILEQRFGNPAALIRAHRPQGVIDLKPVTSAMNVRELRRLFNNLQVHMRGLKALGVGEDSYSTMLYHVLLRALPQEMEVDMVVCKAVPMERCLLGGQVVWLPQVLCEQEALLRAVLSIDTWNNVLSEAHKMRLMPRQRWVGSVTCSGQSVEALLKY
ncbi:hypothetical protein HPB50_020820 [Hyalomma asiaticum]|uniref:Uncharacterized protein n=1 Tax=Hyalomma asiaticum TaxID=266040 RepID=A0ACB7S7Q2_HYAAI|nr:hypothetical protein HPB50_020820 [Hyalomma asiaticum]